MTYLAAKTKIKEVIYSFVVLVFICIWCCIVYYFSAELAGCLSQE